MASATLASLLAATVAAEDVDAQHSRRGPTKQSTTAAIHHQGRVFVKQGQWVDFETGLSGPTARGPDLVLREAGGERVDLQPMSGAQMSAPRAAPGNYATCRNATLSGRGWPVVRSMVGKSACIRTAQGRIATVRIDAIVPDVDIPTRIVVHLTFTVWEG